MATSTNMARSADGLGNGRTDSARKVRASNSGPDLDAGVGGGASLVIPATNSGGGMALADSKDGASQDLKWDAAANIHVRMIRAQASAKALEKTKPKGADAGFLKNGYISHEVVTHEAVRILTAQGIHFQPYLKAHAQEGNRTTVDMEGVFTNVDNPEERLVFMGFGYGVDQSDKGPGKAMSYAKKMVLSQALLLNTHDDIENHNISFEPSVKANAVKEAEATADAAMKTWADAYRAALRGCHSLKDLKQIRSENAYMMNNPALPEAVKSYFVDMITQLEGSLS